jgi:hypothetical protein
MRKGFAVKAAISTVLEKSWAAAAHGGIRLAELDVRFSGTGASVIKTKLYNGIRAVINLPDFKDDVGYSDIVVNRFVAMALHELGHVWFTSDAQWDEPLISNSVAASNQHCSTNASMHLKMSGKNALSSTAGMR